LSAANDLVVAQKSKCRQLIQRQRDEAKEHATQVQNNGDSFLQENSESEEESVDRVTVSLFGGTSYVRMYLSMSKASDHYKYIHTLSTYLSLGWFSKSSTLSCYYTMTGPIF
jgi:hypothetical protein